MHAFYYIYIRGVCERVYILNLIPERKNKSEQTLKTGIFVFVICGEPPLKDEHV